MTKFRPCIDLHQGKVKQIVGASLVKDHKQLLTNFTSNRSAADFAELFAEDGLKGGHLIMLGPKNNYQAIEALKAYPNGLQVGGGISINNAATWIEEGASHVIVTSCLFDENERFDLAKLEDLVKRIGKEKIVIDLSCKKSESDWLVMKDNWQTETDLRINQPLLHLLSKYCDEFLIHATELEGKCQGMDTELIKFLANHCPLRCTYAGGATSLSDLDHVKFLSDSRVDLTIGSGLDIYGGSLVKYKDCVSWNNRD